MSPFTSSANDPWSAAKSPGLAILPVDAGETAGSGCFFKPGDAVCVTATDPFWRACQMAGNSSNTEITTLAVQCILDRTLQGPIERVHMTDVDVYLVKRAMKMCTPRKVAVWVARFATFVSAVLLISSLFVPWAYASIGALDILFGVPGMKACLRHTDVCKKIDWEHTPALPYVLDALLSAAASQTCGQEPFTCGQVLPLQIALL
jgi:hypothetical protein